MGISECGKAYADSLRGRCRSNRGDIWVRKDPKAKERCWRDRKCRTEAPAHCRHHMTGGTLWKNDVKKTEFPQVSDADMFQTRCVCRPLWMDLPEVPVLTYTVE